MQPVSFCPSTAITTNPYVSYTYSTAAKQTSSTGAPQQILTWAPPHDEVDAPATSAESSLDFSSSLRADGLQIVSVFSQLSFFVPFRSFSLPQNVNFVSDVPRERSSSDVGPFLFRSTTEAPSTILPVVRGTIRPSPSIRHLSAEKDNFPFVTHVSNGMLDYKVRGGVSDGFANAQPS